MQVQHGGAGVVAVHGLLDLLVQGHGDLAGKVRGQPRGRIGSGRDDQGLLVFGEQVAVEKVHGMSPCVVIVVQKVGVPTMPARSIFRWLDRKSTRLNSSHLVISYAVFCLKKKKYILNHDDLLVHLLLYYAR